jgi:hypothetical protein
MSGKKINYQFPNSLIIYNNSQHTIFKIKVNVLEIGSKKEKVKE